MEFFLCVLGMVLVVEGLPYFTFPEKMKALMSMMHEQDDTTLRIVGGTLLVCRALDCVSCTKGPGLRMKPDKRQSKGSSPAQPHASISEDFQLGTYTYELPPSLSLRSPHAVRDESRLLALL